MANREEGLDFKHANLALKELATLHALSWCYKVKNGIDKLSSIYPQMVEFMYSSDSFEVQFKPLMDHISSSSLKFIEDTVGSESPIFSGSKRILDMNQMQLMRAYFHFDGVDEDYINNVMRIPNDPPTKGIKSIAIF